MNLYLHIGAGKTGTSVIQAALAQHREALGAAGVLYPDSATDSDRRAARGQISSGNAVNLAWLVAPDNREPGFDEASTRRWLRAVLDEAAGRDVLFSSELLQHAQSNLIGPALEPFLAAGYRPRPIFYLRHAADQAAAVYLQHLKQGFHRTPPNERADSLSAFIAQFTCPYLETLERFAKVIPREDFIMRLYEQEAAELVAGFFRIVAPGLRPDTPPDRVINRSPTPAEQAVFERLAQMPDGVQLCRALTDLILNSPRGEEGRISIARRDFAAFGQRNRPIVEEINRLYPLARGRLHLRSAAIDIDAAEASSAEAIANASAEALAVALRALRH